MFDVYKPSGSIGMKTYPLFLVGIVVAIALAFVYQLLLHWIPFIYVNFLLTLGMGVGTGMIVSFIVNNGHCRNWMIAALLGLMLLIVGLSGKYWFQYQQFLGANIEQIQNDPQIPANMKDLEIAAFKKNFTFMEHLKFRTETGWNVGRGNGAPLTGFMVYLIWLIEAGVIGYFALTMPIAAAKEPYSEKMNTWADEAQVVMTLPVTDPEMVSKIQSASTVDDLLEIPIPKTDQSNQFAVYTVNSIPGEELEDAYLSVASITYSVNKKGEQETKEKSLVNHAVLSAAKREQLIENAELLQEAMAEYGASLLEDAANPGPSDDD